MEWSYDFCLSCDRQISEGAYCSQSCRLVDLDRGNTSQANSPTTSAPSSCASSHLGSGTGFYLPPAVNFGAQRSLYPQQPSPTSPQSYAKWQNSYFEGSSSSHSASSSTSSAGQRRLTPSSSHSSLSSMNTSGQGISTKAAAELRGYVSSFDQVRELKRMLSGVGRHSR